ncbi:MAG: DUF4954 family protein [bacterium]|nr:DUF4954 family protein [Candidatus Sumerlaeota bacterium]
MYQYFPELENVIESSELAVAVKRVKSLKPAGKPVSGEMQKKLEAKGCWAQDWSKVRVADKFNPNHVAGVKFFGECSLGAFEPLEIEVEKGVKLSTGVYNSVLVDTIVEDNALVCNVGLLSNYVVRTGAVVLNTAMVSSEAGTAFGNGVELPIAIETGGREVLTYADINIPVAEKVAKSRDNKELLAEYAAFVKAYVEAVASPKGIIDQGARVSNTGKITNSYIGPYAVVDNAIKVADSTLLSNKDERTEVIDGAYVIKSILQWGCEAASMGIVQESVCTEHSHVERHGKVTQSILGPNTGVAEGEVTASLCGPFVGFHHQSLLIATLWPEGKGNVGYGANIGSNHTSKAPDQELWPGEGMFFGLGCNVKFPSDFTKAPYSVVATGVTALPQKVTFPFSLIITPDSINAGISPAYNEIIPGWVLSDNIFAVMRNEGKYIKRNKARRTKFEFQVFRPEIIDLMIDARNRLKGVRDDRLLAQRDVKSLYTDKDVKGLGKNYMKEDARIRGMKAYTFYIRYYALLGLKKRVEKVLAETSKPVIGVILTQVTNDPRWEHERAVLERELPGKDVAELLWLLIEHQEKIAKDVQTSKEKDDQRGVRIIPDYAYAHEPASQDGFVKETWRVTQELKASVKKLLLTVME